MIVKSVSELIGNTALMEIPKQVSGLRNIQLYAKLELFNPYGSIKDRVAQAMLSPHIGQVKRSGATVVENSSGNTAKALQAICSPEGIPFSLVSGLTKVREQKDILRLMGASIEEVANASDCFDPNDPNDPQYTLERRMAESHGRIFFTSQFTNSENPAAHAATTGREIVEDLHKVDFLIAGVGTAGSSRGTAETLRLVNPSLQVVGLTARRHDYVPGIRSAEELWENGIFLRDNYTELIDVSSRDAIEGMLTLIRKCGIPAGPSSGANFFGALRYLRAIDGESREPQIAVFFACDRMESYLSYVKERRPDIFGENEAALSWHDLSQEDVEEAPSISAVELRNFSGAQRLLVVDTRSTVAYRLGHIPGSINYPLEMLRSLLRTGLPFPKDLFLVFVCQQGVYTRPLAAAATNAGFSAASLRGGYREWLESRVETYQLALN